jgi:hypothetical protein
MSHSTGASLVNPGRWLALVLVGLAACGGSKGGSSGSGGGGGTPKGVGGQLAAGGSGGAAAGTGGAVTTGTGGGGTSGAAGTSTAPVVWRPFSSTSPWNTPISSNPAIDPDSAAFIADLATLTGQGQQALSVNIQGYSIPVYYVDSTVPFVNVMAGLGGTGFRTGAPNEGDIPGSGTAPIPAGATPAAGTDRHLCVVDTAAETSWDLYDANDGSGGSIGWTASLAASMDLTSGGVRPPTNDSPWWAGQGARACGFPLIAGLITVDEVKAGKIEHALVLAYPHIRSRYYTPPASSAQGTTSDAIQTRGVACGGQIQLDPALDLSTLGLSATGLMIAKALQSYGAFVGDYSGAISLYADESATAQAYWSTGVLGNGEVNKIPLTRLRVLKLGTMYDNNN